ncbi:MAG: PA2779 family protein [Bdellovibrionaceae bacterium]|nr:PA2779 family protein [Pseudobdellovibrionaceae bacterium]
MPAFAVANQGMISTTAVITELDREATQQRVQEFIRSTDVQRLLMERGVSAEEASQRIATLSESELHQLAGQVDQARAGGDILITVLIVVLIIFLIKKM